MICLCRGCIAIKVRGGAGCFVMRAPIVNSCESLLCSVFFRRAAPSPSLLFQRSRLAKSRFCNSWRKAVTLSTPPIITPTSSTYESWGQVLSVRFMKYSIFLTRGFNNKVNKTDGSHSRGNYFSSHQERSALWKRKCGQLRDYVDAKLMSISFRF